jgi:cytidine deaminase
MFCLLSSFLLMALTMPNDNISKDFIVYNTSSKVFEISNEKLQESEVENTWKNLRRYLENNFDEKEKIQKFSVKEGFLKDFTYLKNKKINLDSSSFEMLKQWSENTQTSYSQIEEPLEKFIPTNLSASIKKRLILEAQRARTYAYAPYSEFHVGSAVLTRDGKIFSGCNFENAAYGNTICAERVAIAKALSSANRGISIQKNQDIVAIALVIRGGGGSPCGNCRQTLNEFNPDMLVIMSDIDGESIIEKSLCELLPMGFGPSTLEKAKVK